MYLEKVVCNFVCWIPSVAENLIAVGFIDIQRFIILLIDEALVLGVGRGADYF